MLVSDFDSDSLEMLFNNSNPTTTQNNEVSPVIPRMPIPRRSLDNNQGAPTAGKGAVNFHPHVSPTTGERQLPAVTPVVVEPPYTLQSFRSYPNQDTDVTSESVFQHIISDLNNILNTTDR